MSNRKELDWDLLDSLSGVDAALDYCAERQLLKWGEESCKKTIKAAREVIERRIRERYDLTFTEYKSKRIEPIRIKLRQKQIQVAMAGNCTMLIFLGKNYLGQSDKNEHVVESHNTNQELYPAMTKEQARKIVSEKQKQLEEEEKKNAISKG